MGSARAAPNPKLQPWSCDQPDEINRRVIACYLVSNSNAAIRQNRKFMMTQSKKTNRAVFPKRTAALFFYAFVGKTPGKEVFRCRTKRLQILRAV